MVQDFVNTIPSYLTHRSRSLSNPSRLLKAQSLLLIAQNTDHCFNHCLLHKQRIFDLALFLCTKMFELELFINYKSKTLLIARNMYLGPSIICHKYMILTSSTWDQGLEGARILLRKRQFHLCRNWSTVLAVYNRTYISEDNWHLKNILIFTAKHSCLHWPYINM